jgi:hypothetical protein
MTQHPTHIFPIKEMEKLQDMLSEKFDELILVHRELML